MAPIVREGADFPAWCELRAFAVHDLSVGEETGFEPLHPALRVLVTAGTCQVRQGGRSQVLSLGQFVDLSADGAVTVRGASALAQAVVLSGTWGEELGGCGVFRAENVAAPVDKGDPVTYPKHTNVDSHYHDCDEYWLLLEGRAVAVVDGQHVPMTPGDCLLICMGLHHDMPEAPNAVKAVYFESTLRGRKRTGHLWTHTHGPARPGELDG